MTKPKSKRLRGSKWYVQEPMEWASILKPRDFVVHFVLSGFADDKDEAWPSVLRIAKMTNMCERAVQGSLAKLIAIGAIKRTLRKGQTTLYKMLPVPEAAALVASLERDVAQWKEQGATFQLTADGTNSTFSALNAETKKAIHAAFPDYVRKLPWAVIRETIEDVDSQPGLRRAS